MPEAFAAFAAGWRRLHPEWEYTLWGQEKELPELINQDIYDDAESIAPKYVGQLRSDVVRYELLWRYGGVWVDTDFEALKPIDGLLDGVTCFVAWTNPGQWLNNAIMGSEPMHPFIGEVIDRLPDSVVANRGKAPRVMSGPQFVTPLWKANPRDVTVFGKDLFYPYLWNELGRYRDSFPGAYAVHHWCNRRRERGQEL